MQSDWIYVLSSVRNTSSLNTSISPVAMILAMRWPSFYFCGSRVQVEALQAQMEEQTRLAKEQVESLLEDRRIKTEEAQAQQRRDQERITALNDKWVSIFSCSLLMDDLQLKHASFNTSSLIWHLRLQRTQNLLYGSTKDFLQLKFETRAHEKKWMAEKDRLLRELDSCHNRLRKAGPAGTEPGRTWQPSSSTALLLSKPQPEFQQTNKEELKVKIGSSFI